MSNVQLLPYDHRIFPNRSCASALFGRTIDVEANHAKGHLSNVGACEDALPVNLALFSLPAAVRLLPSLHTNNHTSVPAHRTGGGPPK